MSDSEVVIKVENLSKYYHLGVVGTGTLSHDLNRAWAKLRGKPDPTLPVDHPAIKQLSVNRYSLKGKTESDNGSQITDNNFIWALKDISFEVKQGEVLGIIGRNGAGKSTLLKILSRVTAPTSGECRVKGRIASLLEVGTGFHPELTGRENIFLNGAILGMTKAEIKQKFDEIVAFAEVEKFINTPVKRYSSGMYVRLAFAVAAHLEPEILIVDEVLAVGDAEFQKKCLGKMSDVSTEGRTVLFVSHNMAAVEALCSRALLLERGNIALDRDTITVVNTYMSKGESRLSECSYDGNKEHVHFVRSYVSMDGISPQSTISLSSTICVTLEYMVPRPSGQVQIVCHLWNTRDLHIMSTADIDDNSELLRMREAGFYRTKFFIPKNTLAPGNYHLSFACGVPNVQLLDEQQGPAFEVTDVGSYAAYWSGARKDVVIAIPLTWSTSWIDGI